MFNLVVAIKSEVLKRSLLRPQKLFLKSSDPLDIKYHVIKFYFGLFDRKIKIISILMLLNFADTQMGRDPKFDNHYIKSFK